MGRGRHASKYGPKTNFYANDSVMDESPPHLNHELAINPTTDLDAAVSKILRIVLSSPANLTHGALRQKALLSMKGKEPRYHIDMALLSLVEHGLLQRHGHGNFALYSVPTESLQIANDLAFAEFPSDEGVHVFIPPSSNNGIIGNTEDFRQASVRQPPTTLIHSSPCAQSVMSLGPSRPPSPYGRPPRNSSEKSFKQRLRGTHSLHSYGGGGGGLKRSFAYSHTTTSNETDAMMHTSPGGLERMPYKRSRTIRSSLGNQHNTIQGPAPMSP